MRKDEQRKSSSGPKPALFHKENIEHVSLLRKVRRCRAGRVVRLMDV